MLIFDEPLLSGQPLLSVQLPFPRGWPLNRGSTVIIIITIIIITIIIIIIKINNNNNNNNNNNVVSFEMCLPSHG